MAAPVVIENPIINSPYDEPLRHFRFDENGITADVLDERRPSSHFVATAPAKPSQAFAGVRSVQENPLFWCTNLHRLPPATRSSLLRKEARFYHLGA